MLQRIASYIMPDSSKLTFDVDDVISKLTIDEKIALLSGITADFPSCVRLELTG
jgi:hypothetical protein